MRILCAVDPVLIMLAIRGKHDGSRRPRVPASRRNRTLRYAPQNQRPSMATDRAKSTSPRAVPPAFRRRLRRAGSCAFLVRLRSPAPGVAGINQRLPGARHGRAVFQIGELDAGGEFIFAGARLNHHLADHLPASGLISGNDPAAGKLRALACAHARRPMRAYSADNLSPDNRALTSSGWRRSCPGAGGCIGHRAGVARTPGNPRPRNIRCAWSRAASILLSIASTTARGRSHGKPSRPIATVLSGNVSSIMRCSGDVHHRLCFFRSEPMRRCSGS